MNFVLILAVVLLLLTPVLASMKFFGLIALGWLWVFAPWIVGIVIVAFVLLAAYAEGFTH